LATIESEHLDRFCEVKAAQHIDGEFWRQQFCDDATDACRDDFERELLRVLLGTHDGFVTKSECFAQCGLSRGHTYRRADQFEQHLAESLTGWEPQGGHQAESHHKHQPSEKLA